MIDCFKNDYSFLSNFYICLFIYKDYTYASSEHAYQAMKSTDAAESVYIAVSATPGIAKRRGGRCKIRSDWDEVKYGIMKDILICKFMQNRGLLIKLKEIGSEELIEGNFHHDNIWGDCACPKCENIIGKNWLGQILMELRKELYVS